MRFRRLGNVSEFVWERPRITPDGMDELAEGTGNAEALIAVGSGTISDSVKYGTFLTGARIFRFRHVADECLHHAHGIRLFRGI